MLRYQLVVRKQEVRGSTSEKCVASSKNVKIKQIVDVTMRFVKMSSRKLSWVWGSKYMYMCVNTDVKAYLHREV